MSATSFLLLSGGAVVLFALGLGGMTVWLAWARGGLIDTLTRSWRQLGRTDLPDPRTLRWHRPLLRYASELPSVARSAEIDEWVGRYRTAVRAHYGMWIVIFVVANTAGLTLLLLSD